MSSCRKTSALTLIILSGRLIKVQHNKDSWGWGIVVNFQKKGKQAGKSISFLEDCQFSEFQFLRDPELTHFFSRSYGPSVRS